MSELLGTYLRTVALDSEDEPMTANKGKDYPHQEGVWTLTAPDGRTWQADGPLKVAAKEQAERIPATVRLERILDALGEEILRPEASIEQEQDARRLGEKHAACPDPDDRCQHGEDTTCPAMGTVSNEEFIEMLTDFANNPTENGYCPIRPETLFDAISRIAVEPIEQDARRCNWAQGSNGEWLTDCGHIFEFTTGTPAENHATFCQYCGGVIAALQEKQK